MPAPTSSDSVEAAEGLETTSYPFEAAGLGNRHFFWIREVLNSPKIRVIFPLNNQHAVAVGVKAVAVFDRFGVGFHDEFAGGEGRDEHHQGAAGEVEVGLEGADGVEFVRGVDKDVGLAMAGGDFTVTRKVLEDAGNGGPDGRDFFGRLYFGGGLLTEVVALRVHFMVTEIIDFDRAEGSRPDVEGEEGVVEL